MDQVYHTAPLWTFDAPSNTLMHTPTGYWLPLRDHTPDYWLFHVGLKQWSSPADLDALQSAFVSATQVAA